MASQRRIYDQKKLLGQVYTPPHIVEKILRDTGFYELDHGNQKTLDPACGDGRFLLPLARYILENSPSDQLEKQLGNIYGWDIDAEAIKLCRQNLDELVAPYHLEIKWKLFNLDALEQIESLQSFDLIIGNPPYIRIQNLPSPQRAYVQEKYSFCRTGSTDAYLAFFQLASALLTDKGICGFITPNSYFTSETGIPLRSYFSLHKNLKQITNYGSIRIFENTGTYTAITIFGKQPAEKFKYETSEDQLTYQNVDIAIPELDDEPWYLSLFESTVSDGTRLGNLCQISIGLTTLSDRFYLFSILQEKGHLVKVSNKKGPEVWLESGLLKPIVKGSKLKKSSDPITEYILFPYEKDENGKHKIISEQKLEALYPQGYAYLLGVKSELQKRDNGKRNPVAWYAFGRAQALDNSFGKKIIFSPMNRFPNFVLYENPECTVYSGYFIKYDGDYERLLYQLNSQRMSDFIAMAGRDFQGGYKGYNKRALEKFIVISTL